MKLPFCNKSLQFKKTIIKNITSTVDEVLTSAHIPKEKINVMLSELSFLEHDQDLNNTNILKDILY